MNRMSIKRNVKHVSYLKQQNELWKPLDRLHHQPKQRQTIRRTDLPHLQEVGERALPLRLVLDGLHRHGEVVDEVRVDVEDVRLGEGGDEDVPDALFSVPLPHGIG